MKVLIEIQGSLITIFFLDFNFFNFTFFILIQNIIFMTDLQQQVTGEVLGFSDDGNWLITITNGGSNDYTVFDFYGMEGEKDNINITNPEEG
jgi:hypothetical protein